MLDKMLSEDACLRRHWYACCSERFGIDVCGHSTDVFPGAGRPPSKPISCLRIFPPAAELGS